MTTLRIGRTTEHCTVLGPGTRAVLWLAGCHRRCLECTTPEFLDFAAGADTTIEQLRQWLATIEGIEGLTLSGGEPFEQSAALNALLDVVAADRPGLTTMAFTGYTIEELRRGTPDQCNLLSRLDIVVDGPYLPERHSSARWRGSDNQRVHWLTTRHSAARQDMSRSAGVEVLVEPDGAFAVMGVPPTRGFRRDLRRGLSEQQITTGTPRIP